MKARFPWTARIGLCLILTGLSWFCTDAWRAATRTRIPLDIAVSLTPDHSQAAEFRLNVKSTYLLTIETSRPLDALRCPNSPAASWSITDRNGIFARGIEQSAASIAGFFDAGPGRYSAHITVYEDATCLNSTTPRLVIREDALPLETVGGQPLRSFFLSLFLAAVGITLMSRSSLAHQSNSVTHPGPQPPLPRLYSPAPRRSAPKTAKPPFVWPFYRLSWFGLIGAIVFVLLVASFAVVDATKLTIPTGLRISLMKPGVRAQRNAGIQPLLVSVSAEENTRTLVSIDSQPIPWDRFETVLQKELNRRPPDWPVYVEGDPAMDWGHAVKVIDRIRGLHAKVVLLTPSSRER